MRALGGESLEVPPIWLMREAGRYQRRYQRVRRQHSFESLCRFHDRYRAERPAVSVYSSAI